jgi:hypothetical protein
MKAGIYIKACLTPFLIGLISLPLFEIVLYLVQVSDIDIAPEFAFVARIIELGFFLIVGSLLLVRLIRKKEFVAAGLSVLGLILGFGLGFAIVFMSWVAHMCTNGC